MHGKTEKSQLSSGFKSGRQLSWSSVQDNCLFNVSIYISVAEKKKKIKLTWIIKPANEN